VRVELINTGSELLLGQVNNTHLPWLAQELFTLGLRLQRQVTVPDGPSIREAIVEAQSRADLIIITGGLGPTSDDLTRDYVAALLGRPLVLHDDIWQKIQARFRARGWETPAMTRVQAMVPTGARVLANNYGTAPGLLLEENEQIYVLLPGPPRELKPMWTEQVLPWLREHRPVAPLHQKLWHVLGVGESRVQELVEEPLRQLGALEIGYCARPGEVDLRVISPDAALLERAAMLVKEKLAHLITSEGTASLETTVIRLALEKKRLIATAESCTGGLVAHRLTNVPGSSTVFHYGWVTYANEAKGQELGVPPEVINQEGAVSEACVRAMAQGALGQSRAHVAIAVSGIAGPSGGTAEKPVGTCWLALADAHEVITAVHRLSSDRETFKFMASQQALNLLRQWLEKQ
jgi:nicotinamide-nucleotide amidase